MVTLYYNSAWSQPILHYSSSDGSWRDIPLTRTERYFWFRTEVQSCPITFVFTDGHGQWDNPSPICQSTFQRNYHITTPGRYALYHGEVFPIATGIARVLLVTDLDGTLMCENSAEADEASKRFVRYWLQKHYFNGSRLVYSSGRCLEEFLQLRKSRIELLDPDLYVGEVGSDAFSMRNDNGQYELRTDYREAFPPINWDTGLVSRTLDSHFPWLIQPRNHGNTRLTTYRVAKVEDVAAHEMELRAFLSSWRDIRCSLHISGSGSHRYLDFTSQHGGKRASVIFSKQFFAFSNDETLVAGDSGNDIGLFKGPERGVAPANRQEELERWMRKKDRRVKYVSGLKYAHAIIEALSRS